MFIFRKVYHTASHYKLLLLTFLLIFFHAVHSSENPSIIIHHYRVKIDNDLNTLSVTAQFGESDFYRLYANSQKSAAATYGMLINTQPLNPDDSSIRLRYSAAGKKLTYKFNLQSVIGKGRRADAYKVGNDLFIPPGMWLWRPAKLAQNERIEIEFDLPSGVSISVPWKKTGPNRYRLNYSPYDWPSAGAIGRFNVDSIKISGCNIGIAYLDGDYQTSQHELKKWLEGAVESVCNIYGYFPRENVQLILIPVGKSGEAVPFAQVVRGGGFSVKFYIDPGRPLDEFIHDWTATHELSHSLLPFIDRDQAWLSEGLATYYQYVLMARDGRLSEQQAWQRIYNGFQKGKRDSRNLTLKETAENMSRYHAYRFVYWSGAAMMLKADVALREASDGKQSLDTILEKCRKIFLPEDRTWSGKEMLDEMDRQSNTTIFSDLYSEYIYQKEFPIDEAWLQKLGILIQNGTVALEDQAPLSAIRKAIIHKSGL